jgi:hypothetical protein
MTIHLPPDVESSIQAAMHSGHFTSPDALVIEIVRDYFRRHQQDFARPQESVPGMRLIGALRDAAELLDQPVEHAMAEQPRVAGAEAFRRPGPRLPGLRCAQPQPPWSISKRSSRAQQQ